VKFERQYIEVDEEIVSVTTDLDGSFIKINFFDTTKLRNIYFQCI